MPFILLLILVFSISKFIDFSLFAVKADSYWWQYLTFNLCHASVIHLIINSLALYVYWRILKQIVNKLVFFPVLIISVVLSAMFGVCEIPTVGASVICYSMVGIYTVAMYYIPLNISRNKRIEFLALIAISFLVTGLFAPSVNTNMHIYSFFIATALSFISRRYMYAIRKK